jgi:hypothetical protein
MATTVLNPNEPGGGHADLPCFVRDHAYGKRDLETRPSSAQFARESHATGLAGPWPLRLRSTSR